MINRRLLLLISIILFIAVTAFGADKAIVDCKISRITVPLAEYNGKVTFAASFVYGAYVENPNNPDDFINSADLMDKVNELPEEERWQYPEYVVFRHFQEMKADNKAGILSCYAPGYDRDKEESLYKPLSEAERSLLNQLDIVLFVDKSYFGPYVRIYFIMSGISESGSTKGCKRFPGYLYLKRVDNRYVLAREINMTHLFDDVARTYGYRKLTKRENIPLNPDVSGMDWFAMDVDTGSPAENKKWLKVYSSEGITDIPKSFSENYLKVYVKCEPVNVQLEAGKQARGLSEQMRFFESAVTAHQLGTESEILSKWSGKAKERIGKDIKRIKDAGQWPESRLSRFNFGPAPTVVALLRTSAGTVSYYKKKSFGPPEWAKKRAISQAQSEIYNVGLQEEQGNYTLFNASSKGEFNVFTNKMFMDAVNVLYGH